MEIRTYNLLRHGKYDYPVIPSEYIALIMRRDKERKARLNKATKITDKIIWGLMFCGFSYLTYHLFIWAIR